MKRISIGILGAGAFSRGFVRLFRDHPLVERLAICDLLPERTKDFCETFELSEAYNRYENMLAADLDAVAVFTQPWMHAPQAIQAMEAGKAAWSAVPMIMLPNGDEVLDWADKIVQTSRRTGKHYMMAETSHYRPGAMYCRRQLASGAFGQIVYAEGAYYHDFDSPGSNLIDVSKHRWGDQWDMSKNGDTPMHYPTHSVGAVLSVVPAHVKKVSCIGRVFPNDEWHRKDTMWKNPFANETALMKLSDGSSMRINEFRRTGRPNYEGCNIYGTDGTYMEVDEDTKFWMTKTQQEMQPLTASEIRDPLPPEVFKAWRAVSESDESVYGGHGGSHAYLVHEFIDAVANDRHPAVNAWQAARYVAPGVMAHKSAMRDGEWLDVPDWGDPPA